MKKIMLLASLSVLIATFVSCNPPEPTDQTNPDICLATMLHYLPYEANRSYTFVHEGDDAQWTITPYVENSVSTFPTINHSGYIDSSKDSWENHINAYFNVIGIQEEKTTDIIMSVYSPEEGKFQIRVYTTLRLSKNISCLAGINSLVNSEGLNNFWSDTIVLPVIGITDVEKKESLEVLDQSVAYLVKNKGLAEFSIDGGRTYWRLAE